MQFVMRKRAVAAIVAVVSLVLTLVTHPFEGASASVSKPPFGRLASTSVISSVTGITDVETEITPITTTFQVDDPGSYSSRWVKVTAVVRVSATASSTVNAYLDLDDNWCNVCTTQRVGGSTTYLVAIGGAGAETMVVHGFAYLRVSNFTARVKVKRAAGTGTITTSQTGGVPMTMLVEDMGGA